LSAYHGETPPYSRVVRSRERQVKIKRANQGNRRYIMNYTIKDWLEDNYNVFEREEMDKELNRIDTNQPCPKKLQETGDIDLLWNLPTNS